MLELSQVQASSLSGEMGETLSRCRNQSALMLMYNGCPEPPTLNAILILKQHFKTVTLFRNNWSFPEESYPSAPYLLEIGREIDIWSGMRKSSAWKLRRFAYYCFALAWHLRVNSYPIAIVHDYLALLALSLVRGMSGYRGLTWFNSYDVIDQDLVRTRPFTLMGCVVRRFDQLFSELDFFSVPAGERLPYYPVSHVRQKSFVIPNYPAQLFYGRFLRHRTLDTQKHLRLIFQGAIGRGHGIKKIIKILNRSVAGKPLELVLKGWIEESYKKELLDLAIRCGTQDRLLFAGFGSYRSVPETASQCSIGLAIFTGKDIMNATLGTASNKIYEYAALGLPVILYDTPHFRRHLGDRQWAFFTTLSEASLMETLQAIIYRYDTAVSAAIEDFESRFNFERVFEPALHTVLGYIGS